MSHTFFTSDRAFLLAQTIAPYLPISSGFWMTNKCNQRVMIQVHGASLEKFQKEFNLTRIQAEAIQEFLIDRYGNRFLSIEKCFNFCNKDPMLVDLIHCDISLQQAFDLAKLKLDQKIGFDAEYQKKFMPMRTSERSLYKERILLDVGCKLGNSAADRFEKMKQFFSTKKTCNLDICKHGPALLACMRDFQIDIDQALEVLYFLKLSDEVLCILSLFHMAGFKYTEKCFCDVGRSDRNWYSNERQQDAIIALVLRGGVDMKDAYPLTKGLNDAGLLALIVLVDELKEKTVSVIKGVKFLDYPWFNQDEQVEHFMNSMRKNNYNFAAAIHELQETLELDNNSEQPAHRSCSIT